MSTSVRQEGPPILPPYNKTVSHERAGIGPRHRGRSEQWAEYPRAQGKERAPDARRRIASALCVTRSGESRREQREHRAAAQGVDGGACTPYINIVPITRSSGGYRSWRTPTTELSNFGSLSGESREQHQQPPERTRTFFFLGSCCGIPANEKAGTRPAKTFDTSCYNLQADGRRGIPADSAAFRPSCHREPESLFREAGDGDDADGTRPREIPVICAASSGAEIPRLF